MDRFHALIGPNASGKSTYLDVVRFLGDMVQPGGLDAAIDSRTQNWHDLVWMGEEDSVSLRGCKDDSFQRFRQILQRWFPPSWKQ